MPGVNSSPNGKYGGCTCAGPRDADGRPRPTYIPKGTLKLFTGYRPRRLLEGLALGASLRWQDRVYTDINDSGWYGEPRSAFLNLRYAF